MLNSPGKIENLSLDEFVRIYEKEGAFEIINGEKITLMPSVAIQVITVKRLMQLLMDYEQAHTTGYAFSEAPFVLTYDSNWVQGSRVPDVMFFRTERLADYKAQTADWLNKPFIIVPDLAVEVVSANDSYSDIAEKVELYLQDGVLLIWAVDPKRKTITVHPANTNQQVRLNIDDTLTGGDVLPGFEVSIAQMFDLT